MSGATKLSKRWLLVQAAVALLGAALLLATQGCELHALAVPGDAGPGPDAGDAGTGGGGGDGGAGGSGVRQLVTRRLFGQMPLDNRMHDPGFALVDGTGWSPWVWDGGYVRARVTRTFLARSPLDQPALRIMRPEDETYCQVLGQAKGTTGPLEASLWLGRAGGESPTEGVQVALLGTYLDQTPSAVDLVPDPSFEPKTLDGIAWQRLSAALADGPVGLTYLQVQVTTASAVYISSPLLVAPDSATPMQARPTAQRRALTHRERQALRTAAANNRERFTDGRPPMRSGRQGVRLR